MSQPLNDESIHMCRRVVHLDIKLVLFIEALHHFPHQALFVGSILDVYVDFNSVAFMAPTVFLDSSDLFLNLFGLFLLLDFLADLLGFGTVAEWHSWLGGLLHLFFLVH